MNRQLASGQLITSATEEDLRVYVPAEQFVVLGSEKGYMQCSEVPWSADESRLEYQAGSLAEHYFAADTPITLERVIGALTSYLRGDQGWHSAFRWKKMDLS